MKKRLLPLFTGLFIAAGGAGLSGAAGNPGYIISPDGQEVLDVSAGLVWRRCVEGMRWNGRICAGTPLALEHGQAAARANEVAAIDGKSWRLPSATQLRRLAQRRGADAAWSTFFPATPTAWHWSASVNVSTAPVNAYNYGNVMNGVTGSSVNRVAFMHGWAVNFGTGEARGDVLKRQPLPVRLVRSRVP